MGGVRSFRIEFKRFDLIREGDGIDLVSLIESGRYMRHSVSMGKEGARWLAKCIEVNIARETERAFIRMFKEGDKGYVIRRFTNTNGRYLELTNYGRGGCKGRLAIPEGQNQSGWRGFNKELTLLLNPSPVDTKHGQDYKNLAEDNTKKRIPAKDRLGPAASYADLLRVPDKFLGVNPYRRLGTDTAVPKLWILINVDGKRTVMWDRQEKHVEVAEAGIKARQRLSGGPIKEKATYDAVEAVEASRAKNNDVEDLDTSRASVLDLTSTTPAFTQKLTCLVFRTTREGDYQRFRVDYYVGINISVSRNIAGYWGDRHGEAFTTLLMGDSNKEWVDDVDEAERAKFWRAKFDD
uniref:Uncharacterized protein n=1 Tax=Fagus sylvatica TaxID=28930 RepID=A0A2N9FXG6_FAGSY